MAPFVVFAAVVFVVGDDDHNDNRTLFKHLVENLRQQSTVARGRGALDCINFIAAWVLITISVLNIYLASSRGC